MISSAVALYFLFDFPIARIGALMKGVTWTSIASWEVASVPLFIWMGEILFRTDISARLFKGIAPFVDKIPGKLLHTNLLG
jgi:TRAP-type mannitol/chloroaromatic compound transport system permease large subunit